MRGLEHGATTRGRDAGHEAPSSLRALLSNPPPLVSAALMATFLLANAAMLPSVKQLLASVMGGNETISLIAVCIVAAQCSMTPVSSLVGAKVDVWGHKPIFLVAFGMLALRGLLSAYPTARTGWSGCSCLRG